MSRSLEVPIKTPKPKPYPLKTPKPKPIKTPKAIGKDYKASAEVIHKLSMVVDNYTL